MVDTTLDFNKIREAPADNSLTPASELQNVVIQRLEKKVLAQNQTFSSARAIELLDRLRTGMRDFQSDEAISRIKTRLLNSPAMTDQEKDSAYQKYLEEMGKFGFDAIMDKEEFIFYRDPKNLDDVIKDIIEQYGMEKLPSE